MAFNRPSLFGACLFAGDSAASSLYATGYLPQTISAGLSDSIAGSDAGTIAMTAALADFLVIKEWLAVNLSRATVWVNPGANENTFDSLFGKYMYGRVPFGGVTPTSTWTAGAKRTENWTQSDGHKNG